MLATVKTMAEKPTTVRFAPNLNARIRRFAEQMGISVNAALSVLATEALDARDRAEGKRES